MGVDFDSRALKSLMDRFARAVDYAAPGGSPVQRRGVFSRPHETVLDGEGSAHSADLPQLGIRTAEWDPAPVQRGRVTVPGAGAFEIFDVQPDGEGGASLILRDVT